MYHPMLTFALALTRLDEIERDQRHRARSHARSQTRTPRWTRHGLTGLVSARRDRV